jgi:hypothetical protein
MTNGSSLTAGAHHRKEGLKEQQARAWGSNDPGSADAADASARCQDAAHEARNAVKTLSPVGVLDSRLIDAVLRPLLHQAIVGLALQLAPLGNSILLLLVLRFLSLSAQIAGSTSCRYAGQCACRTGVISSCPSCGSRKTLGIARVGCRPIEVRNLRLLGSISDRMNARVESAHES